MVHKHLSREVHVVIHYNRLFMVSKSGFLKALTNFALCQYEVLKYLFFTKKNTSLVSLDGFKVSVVRLREVSV